MLNPATSSLVDIVLQLDAARIAECAEDGYNALRDVFSRFPERWERARLVQLHEQNRSNVIQLLKEDQALSRSIQRQNLVFSELDAHSCGVNCPVILTDISTLLSALLSRYARAFSGDHRVSIENVLKSALDSVAADLVVVCIPQIHKLGQVVFTILHEHKVVARSNRIILVELPVGNSIPIRILRHFLEKHMCKAETLRVSLSRNDTQHKGITRRQLLESRLAAIVTSGDVVIYLDEWLTGSNFRTVSEHIASVLRASQAGDVSLLPVGMLTDNSRFASQYSSCVRRHKTLVECAGFGFERSSRFRIEFPPLSGILPRPGHFFWGEHDWMAGYRKVQLLGMAATVVDEAVERLMKSQLAWSEATKLFLVQVAKWLATHSNCELDIPRDIIDHPESCLNSSYEDYKHVRNQIRAIAHPSNLGECDDPIEGIKDLGARILEIINDRPARVCVGLGLALSAHSSETQFRRQDVVFKEHVPLVVELEYPLRWFHDRLTQRIIAAIED